MLIVVVVLMFGWDVGGWIVGCGLQSGDWVLLVDCELWSGDWVTDDWTGLGCSALGGLWRVAARVVLVVRLLFVGGVPIVGGRLQFWDTDLAWVCRRHLHVA